MNGLYNYVYELTYSYMNGLYYGFVTHVNGLLKKTLDYIQTKWVIKLQILRLCSY